MMDWESQGDDMPEDQLVNGFQNLVDSRLALSLQGMYGRAAASLIRAGLVRDTHGDFTGVPAKSIS